MTLTHKNLSISLFQKLAEDLTKFRRFDDVIIWPFINFMVTLNDLEVNKTHNSIARNFYKAH